MQNSPRQQLERFEGLLKGKKLDCSSPTFLPACTWLKTFPGELTSDERTRFRTLVCETYNITEPELDVHLSSVKRPTESSGGDRYSKEDMVRAQALEDEFISMVPVRGFFRDYIDYTMESAAPVAFHFFCAVVGLATILNRRVYFSMGPTGRIYPPLGIILLGPSGIKKTSASDIMVNMIAETELVPIYAEKVTPEALIEGMKTGKAVGLVYAPEMAVFLSRQKYMEGIVPLLTRFMDSPDKWINSTIGRGQTVLSEIAITTLMCSTPDWFISNTPEDMFGGGFIARNLLVMQNISPRIIPIPKPRNEVLRQRIINTLIDLHQLSGECSFDQQAHDAYVTFYYDNVMKRPEHEMLESYHQRKPSHAIRIAMLLHISTCGELQICLNCFLRALEILQWNEQFLPMLLRQMFRSNVGIESEKVLKAIKSSGGVIAHSTLIRKMQHVMNAAQVRVVINSLKESDTIVEETTKFSHTYTLKEGYSND